MKQSTLLLLMFLLLSFTPIQNSKKEVLFKCEKGNLILDNDFLKINFQIQIY
jgi:hypothetical protein